MKTVVKVVAITFAESELKIIKQALFHFGECTEYGTTDKDETEQYAARELRKAIDKAYAPESE